MVGRSCRSENCIGVWFGGHRPPCNLAVYLSHLCKLHPNSMEDVGLSTEAVLMCTDVRAWAAEISCCWPVNFWCIQGVPFANWWLSISEPLPRCCPMPCFTLSYIMLHHSNHSHPFIIFLYEESGQTHPQVVVLSRIFEDVLEKALRDHVNSSIICNSLLTFVSFARWRRRSMKAEALLILWCLDRVLLTSCTYVSLRY